MGWREIAKIVRAGHLPRDGGRHGGAKKKKKYVMRRNASEKRGASWSIEKVEKHAPSTRVSSIEHRPSGIARNKSDKFARDRV